MVTHKVDSTDFQQFMMTVNMQESDTVAVMSPSGNIAVFDYQSAWDVLLLKWRFDNDEKHTTVLPSWVVNYNGAKTKLLERILGLELDHEVASTRRIIQELHDGTISPIW